MNKLQQTWISHKDKTGKNIPACLLRADDVTRNIQDIIHGHRISKEDEKKILLRIRGGDTGAREWFIYSKMELVRMIARTLTGNMIEFDDLVQLGLIGLLEAIDKHDMDKGYFDNYAQQRIRGTMQDAIRHEIGNLSTGGGTRNVPKIRSVYDSILQKKFGVKPTLGELMEETGLSERIISNYFHLNYLTRLEDTSNTSDGNDNTHNIFHQACIYAINEDISENEYKKILSLVKEAYENMQLSDTERYIMEHYYGLDGRDPIRFHEIGKNCGYTEGRISQIHKDIILRLKKYMESKGYRVDKK